MIRILLFCASGLVSTNAATIQEAKTSDILDLYAWVGTWYVALGAYSGRQERPWRRRGEGPLDDLPDIYIPNELTGNEIERSFSLAGKKQAVIEANEMLQYLEFVGTGRQWPEDAFIELKDGYIHAHPQVFQHVRRFLSSSNGASSNFTNSPTRGIGLDKELVDTIVQLLSSLKIKSKFDDWNDMSSEIDRIYQEVVRTATDKNYLKQTEDGHYTLTSTVTELVHKLVNDTILARERRWILHDENDFESYQEYQKIEENAVNIVNSATAIVQLPGDMTWARIKSAIQAMYKKAIPQVHLFQFLTKNLKYLTLDNSVGLSKLSPVATQALVDAFYSFPTPLRQ